MILVDNKNNYPRFMGDLLVQHPKWQEGDSLPNGWHEVQDTMPPQISVDEVFAEEYPKLVDGQYIRTWSVRPLTDEEIDRRKAPARLRAALESLGLGETEIALLKTGMF
jgi:hypothetical protein